jgi:hypothetical protein
MYSIRIDESDLHLHQRRQSLTPIIANAIRIAGHLFVEL